MIAEASIQEILDLKDEGLGVPRIADIVGTSYTTVRKVIAGRKPRFVCDRMTPRQRAHLLQGWSVVGR